MNRILIKIKLFLVQWAEEYSDAGVANAGWFQSLHQSQNRQSKFQQVRNSNQCLDTSSHSSVLIKWSHYFPLRAILPSHYKVKEYCPLVFKNMRQRFKISEESYIKSLTSNELEPLDISSEKTNAKFYISYDKRYIVKLITSEDVEGLHNILTEYHKVNFDNLWGLIVISEGSIFFLHLLCLRSNKCCGPSIITAKQKWVLVIWNWKWFLFHLKHIVETKGDTLLPHMTSLFRLTVENKENYILVSRNVFDKKHKIHMKYDIKGSSVDRAASSKEKEKDTPTLKDNDLINDGRNIHIGAESKQSFMKKLTKDVEVSKLKILD